jgi:hypothetical protein
MNHHYDISILVPGIRTGNWDGIYQQVRDGGCKRFTFEFVFCGPYPLSPFLQAQTNVKYIKDYGTPTRALQMASLLAEGKFLTWISDDGYVYPDSIDKAMDILLSMNPEKDIIGMRYCEGPGHSGNEHTHPIDYANVTYHADLQAPCVNRSWLAPGIMLIANAYYRFLGGLDCRFEHTNMNLYDMAYRAQMNGSKVVMTPFLYLNCDFQHGRTPENSEVIAAFFQNDRQLYWDIWSRTDRAIQIDLEGWRDADVIWKRKKY